MLDDYDYTIACPYKCSFRIRIHSKIDPRGFVSFELNDLELRIHARYCPNAPVHHPTRPG